MMPERIIVSGSYVSLLNDPSRYALNIKEAIILLIKYERWNG